MDNILSSNENATYGLSSFLFPYISKEEAKGLPPSKPPGMLDFTIWFIRIVNRLYNEFLLVWPQLILLSSFFIISLVFIYPLSLTHKYIFQSNAKTNSNTLNNIKNFPSLPAAELILTELVQPSIFLYNQQPMAVKY